jgi:hypothetical protein
MDERELMSLFLKYRYRKKLEKNLRFKLEFLEGRNPKHGYQEKHLFLQKLGNNRRKFFSWHWPNMLDHWTDNTSILLAFQ